MGGKKKLFIMIGLAVLVLGGMAGAFLAGRGAGAKKPIASAKGEAGAEKEVAADAAKTSESEGKAKEGEAKEGESAKKEGESKEKEGEAKEKEGEGAKEGGAKDGAVSKKDMTFQFEKEFLVNLADPSGVLFLKTGIKIETGSLKARQEIEDNVAPLTDATIMLLSSKKKEDFDTLDGKDRLKRELRARYENFVDPKLIKNIYFDNFQVVQSR